LRTALPARWLHAWSRLQEKRLDVPLEQVLRHVPRNRRLTRTQHRQIAGAHLRRHLITYVQQLPHVGIELRTSRIMPQGAGVLAAAPTLYYRGIGEPGVLDIDDAGVGLAEFLPVRERLGINLFGDFQAVAVRFRK